MCIRDRYCRVFVGSTVKSETQRVCGFLTGDHACFLWINENGRGERMWDCNSKTHLYRQKYLRTEMETWFSRLWFQNPECSSWRSGEKVYNKWSSRKINWRMPVSYTHLFFSLEEIDPLKGTETLFQQQPLPKIILEEIYPLKGTETCTE